jgi:hypothetical protein
MHRWQYNIKIDLKENGREGVDWIHLRTGTNGAPFEYGNELSGSIKGREFFDWLSDYHLLKKDSAPWRYLVGLLRPPSPMPNFAGQSNCSGFKAVWIFIHIQSELKTLKDNIIINCVLWRTFAKCVWIQTVALHIHCFIAIQQLALSDKFFVQLKPCTFVLLSEN